MTADVESRVNSRGAREERYFLKKGLADAVGLAGGLSSILPFVRVPGEAGAVVGGLDGLLISGGDFDVDPLFYGEKRSEKCGPSNWARTQSEFLLLAAAVRANLPVLGVCGGAQLINVFYGGTLHQDIPSEVSGALAHSQKEPHDKTSHEAAVTRGSFLWKIIGAARLRVNSTHHQCVKELGTGLRASAASKDGLVEAVEGRGGFMLGVQWHPEFLVKNERHLAIFKAFVGAAQKRKM
ncbi:MAG: gamma-glutamyl-gamma-aminobutyrate hydrolase family protein [Nitrospinae bacterium]|nr:gamma-glutamyl-gamma-aminobutyrate hydrolase family protein [Nitrospinota bacterium]